ncbi:MAG: SDR family NAD(P)-dependent oxidoreductase, partial [Actinomycetota bacterium]
MRLKNKFAVIIGGAIGIGAAITNAFAREGCDLLITHLGEKEKDEAARISEEVKKFGIKFYYEDLNVLKKDQITA